MVRKLFIIGAMIWIAALVLLVHIVRDERQSVPEPQVVVLVELVTEPRVAPIPAARPVWRDHKFTDADYTCMADNVYHEARGESVAGQKAVVGVVFARMADKSGRWPNSVCEVVYQYKAFSWTLDNPPVNNPQSWMAIRSAVADWMENETSFPAGDSDHYHADYMTPYWAGSMTSTVTIGAHKFYSSSPG